MILEERDYLIVPGQLNDFLEVYRTQGFPIQDELLGGLVGQFTSEIGELNRVVTIWRYDSLNDREIRRRNMLAHPGWANYLSAIRGMISHQSIRILKPTSISPLR